MAYIIAEPCYTTKDKACVPACPVDCIYEGPKMLYIHPEECIDCGACVEPCPVQAIFPADELPEKWKFYIEVNKNFFPEKDEAKAWVGHTIPPEKEQKH
jgi:NAD-dependent dihydropyrimidine dehydrogenase PreA subunit